MGRPPSGAYADRRFLVDTFGQHGRTGPGLGLAVIGKVLKSLNNRDGVRVICGDAQKQTAAKVFDPKRIELPGGGGTDMARLIREVAEDRPPPQLIVVVTDGMTPWPDKPLRMPVAVCLTRKESRVYPVPSWMFKVSLVGTAD